MKTNSHRIMIYLLVAAMGLPALAGMKGNPHDLSASITSDACRFCHTPHGALPKTPGWSQKLSSAVYKIYQSSSLEAKIGQPTGPSKLCLSCHDGTVAMTHIKGEGPTGIYITPGRANLGTDLSDDHPISFVYSNSLSVEDSQIRLVSTLPKEIKLDRHGEIQCTTCHDPHDNQYGNFMVMSNLRSAMCTSCHDLDNWLNSSHENSTASMSSSHDKYLRDSKYTTVADNGCQSCHRSHSAGKPERLLNHAKSEDNCLSCHDGTVAVTNLRSALSKRSRHDVKQYNNIHDLRESPLSSPRHVECVDCHNPHAVQNVDATAPYASGSIRGVTGVTASGSVTQQIQYEYEVCFKCHADNPTGISSNITRQITQTNTRLEFNLTSPSYHPVVGVGVNQNVPSLIPPRTVNTMIYCTDCHSSDPSSNVKGPHGSNFTPMLAYHYDTNDHTSESEYAYQLCYTCHSRNSILNNESFPKHREHIDDKIPCSACHDSHGISAAQGTSSANSHLINFDTVIVSPDIDTGRLEFQDTGIFSGSCYLQCHGKNHSSEEY